MHSITVKLVINTVLLITVPSLHDLGPLSAPRFSDASRAPTDCGLTIHHTTPTIIGICGHNLGAGSRGRLRVHALKSNMVVSRHNCVVAGGRIVGSTSRVVITLRSKHMFRTLLIKSSSLASLTMLGVGTANNLPAVPVGTHHMPRVNSIMLTVNGPCGLKRAVARKVVDTANQVNLGPAKQRGFLRASTSVGRNGSNNTLIGSLKRLVNVGALSFSGDGSNRAPRNVNFTVPFRLTAGVVSGLVHSNHIVHNCVNVNKHRVTPLRTRNNNVSRLRKVIIGRISPSNPTTGTNVRIGSLVVSISGGPTVSTLRAVSRITRVHPNSIVPIMIVHSSGRLALRIAVRRCPTAGWIIHSGRGAKIYTPIFCCSLVGCLLAGSSPETVSFFDMSDVPSDTLYSGTLEMPVSLHSSAPFLPDDDN